MRQTPQRGAQRPPTDTHGGTYVSCHICGNPAISSRCGIEFKPQAPLMRFFAFRAKIIAGMVLALVSERRQFSNEFPKTPRKKKT